MSVDLASHDEALQIVSDEGKQIQQLKEMVRERDSSIQTLLEKNKNDESAIVTAMRQDLMKV